MFEQLEQLAEDHQVDLGALRELYNDSPSYYDEAGADKLIDDLESAYLGEFDSEIEFTEWYIKEYCAGSEVYDIPEWLERYVDYQSIYDSDIRYSTWESNGHYFLYI